MAVAVMKAIAAFAISYFLVVGPFGSFDKMGHCLVAALQKEKDSNMSCSSVISNLWKLASYSSLDEREEEPIIKLLEETGLEFIRDDSQLEFNERDYFEEDEKTFALAMSPVEVVQYFIDHIKGINHLPTDGRVGMGNAEFEQKPYWAFQPYRLKILAEIEIKMYHILKRHYNQHPEIHPFPALESYFIDVEQSTLKVLSKVNSINFSWNKDSLQFEDPLLYIGSHPLLIYRMLRRFSEDLQPILLSLTDRLIDSNLTSEIEEANSYAVEFPDKEDLEDAWKSIFRIQNLVNIKTFDIASGQLQEVDTGLGVSALQALEIGTFYLEESHMDYAIEWIYLATESIKNSPVVVKYPFIRKIFEKYLEFSVNRHNVEWEHRKVDQWNPGVFEKIIEVPYSPTRNVRMIDALMKDSPKSRHLTEWNYALKLNFIHTCAGRNLQTEEEKARLKCLYYRTSHPYWYINPLKVEVLHKNAGLYQIHDFLGDKLIEEMKKTVKNDLKRSTVIDRNHHSRSVIDPTRTSTQSWIFEDKPDGKFMQPLTRLLEMMTDLHILPEIASDAYQVALYGPSHHYEAHIDSFDDERRLVEKGNRMTTIMGYLSNVELGGKTGFPVMGVSATPKKGSLVMWHNLMPNAADRDMTTWHGGCPVVLGLKWITNKWVYARENLFTYKCPKTPGAEGPDKLFKF